MQAGRRIDKQVLACLAALAGSLCLLESATAQEPDARGAVSPRNVLVVMTDDQSTSDMRALGATSRRIGGRGARFTEAFASFPLCCPSRATYLTGQYAHNHDVLSNHPPEGAIEAFDDSATTAVALDEAGYRTGWVGKYLNGYQRVATSQTPPYEPPGFDWWRAASESRKMYRWQQVIAGRLHRWGHADRDYQTDVYARQAERFVETSAASGTPFFLTVAPLAPHVETRFFQVERNPRPARRHWDAFESAQLPRPPSFNEADVSDKPSFIRDEPRADLAQIRSWRRANRDRLASLRAVDELVVRLVRALRRGDVLDDTLLVFTSDNGYLLGQHRLHAKNAFYDGAARVPLLLRAPGIDPATVIGSPVVNTDLAATVYDFTGVEPALPQDGVSLLDVAADPGRFADRAFPMQTTRGTAIRTPEWLYAEHETEDGPEFELYDLAADPHQLTSRHDSPSYEDVRDELAERLADLRECAGSECR
jgi:N-acetylglucosamine-6-sulfatase